MLKKIKKCVVKECGKEFKPYNTIQKYCSRDCQITVANQTYYAKNEPFRFKPTSKLCEFCGEIFIQNNNQHLFCNTLCRNRSHAETRKQNAREVTYKLEHEEAIKLLIKGIFTPEEFNKEVRLLKTEYQIV